MTSAAFLAPTGAGIPDRDEVGDLQPIGAQPSVNTTLWVVSAGRSGALPALIAHQAAPPALRHLGEHRIGFHSVFQGRAGLPRAVTRRQA